MSDDIFSTLSKLAENPRIQDAMKMAAESAASAESSINNRKPLIAPHPSLKTNRLLEESNLLLLQQIEHLRKTSEEGSKDAAEARRLSRRANRIAILAVVLTVLLGFTQIKALTLDLLSWLGMLFPP